MNSLLFVVIGSHREDRPRRTLEVDLQFDSILYVCLHSRGGGVRQTLVVYKIPVENKEKFTPGWTHRLHQCFWFFPPHYWSFIFGGIYFRIHDSEKSPHFLSYPSSPCHQLCLCVSAWFYLLGNETEGNPKSTDKISLRNSFTVHNNGLLLSKNRYYKIPTGGFSSCVLMEIKKDREVGHTQISCGNSAQMCVTESPGTVLFKGKTELSWYTLRAWWRLSSVCVREACAMPRHREIPLRLTETGTWIVFIHAMNLW